ncbi:MAG: hypothetical protein WCB71_14855, partial [Aestuariivirga sp.]
MNELIEKRVSWASRHAGIITSVFVGYAALTLLAQVEFPKLPGTLLSPVEVSLWVVIFASLIGTVAKLSACVEGGRMRRFWILATSAVAAITVMQSADWFSEVAHTGMIYGFVNVALSIGVAAGLLWIIPLPKEREWLSLFLKAAVVFQCLSLLADAGLLSGLLPAWSWTPRIEFSTEFVELLCIESYLVALAYSRANTRRIPRHSFATGLHVGANARRLYQELNLFGKPQHPPIRLAFYPVFREATVFVVSLGLAIWSGPAIARATGRPVMKQFWDMLALWFRDGIDPPSYYALEMFRAGNARDAGHFLTRYETKNGLMKTLNNWHPRPSRRSEMGNKIFFAECCVAHNIPCPQTLLSIRDGEVE